MAELISLRPFLPQGKSLMDSWCDCPGCRNYPAWRLHFEHSDTPGLDSLDLCSEHKEEVLHNYGTAGANEIVPRSLDANRER